MKLTTGINISDQHFMHFFLIQKCSNYSLALIFWRKNIGTKAARKMSMKLTTGINFSNQHYLPKKLDHLTFIIII